MKKNMTIIALVFAIPLIAFGVLSNSNSTTAKPNVGVVETGGVPVSVGKPQVIKFSSAMCLDCQTMNKLFKEVFPKYNDRIVLTEHIAVQDLISVARFVLLPEDDLNLACLLKCPLFKISEEELFEQFAFCLLVQL